MKVKKIWIGNNRPSEKELFAMFNEKGVHYNAGYFWCPCMAPDIHSTIGSYLPHLAAGHYDTSVHKYVWEENGRIVESLEMPKGGEL